MFAPNPMAVELIFFTSELEVLAPKKVFLFPEFVIAELDPRAVLLFPKLLNNALDPIAVLLA